MDELAPGLVEMNTLRQAGFNDSELNKWQEDTAAELEAAGFQGKELDEYFGVKNPDLSSTESLFKANLQKKIDADKPVEGAEPKPVKPEPQSLTPQVEQADNFLEAIEAGFDMSVTGLIAQGRPDMILPEHAPMWYRIASQVGTLAGDVPAMLAGAIAGAPIGGAAGGAAGSVVPVVGNVAGAAAGVVVGAGAGAFALPEGMRTALMDHYEKGDIESFSDFWERASAVTISTLKGAAIGGLTAGVGGAVGKVTVGVAAPAIAKTTAQLMAEVTTMTTVGAALDGRVPEPHEFIDGAILVGGMRGAVAGASRLRAMYAKTGAPPAEVVQEVQNNPKLKQQLLSENNPPVQMGGEKIGPATPAVELTPVEKVKKLVEGGKVWENGETISKGLPEEIITLKNGKQFAIRGEIVQDTQAPNASGIPKTLATIRVYEVGGAWIKDKVGELGVSNSKTGETFGASNVGVDNVSLRRQGMATAMYDYAEKHGMKMGPGRSGLTPDSLAFWENRNKVKAEAKANGYSDATKTILGNVGEKAARPKKSMTVAQTYTNLVDKLDPFNQANKTLIELNRMVDPAFTLTADKNSYILARTAVDYKSKAKHMFERGTIDFETKAITGKGLSETLRSVENVEVLEAYLISKRVLEKSKQGLETGFDVKAAEAVVKEHGPKYEAAAKEVTEFSNRVLDYVHKSGILSKEQVARIKESNKDYTPFKRLMDPAEAAAGKKGGGKGGSLKEFKGSERGIQSPITSIVENTIELVRMAEVNRPKKALVELAKATPGQEILKPVPDRLQGIKVTAEEIAQAQKQLPEASVETLTDMIIFRKQQMDLAPNQFAVFEQGKRRVYETTPELAESIARLGGDAASTNILFKIMNGVTTVKKIGITLTPDFILRNMFRDYLTASTFSKSKGMSPVDIFGAMGDLWKKNDTYYEWLKSGGANGAFLEMGDRYIKNDIYKLQKETNFFNSVRNLVQKPVDIMRVAAELSEQSLRVAEFKKVRKAGGSLTEGGFASREITIDFQRVGAKISALNSITAFMNVSIQGLDRTARAFHENPTAIATKSVAYITVPSVLLWWANHDDPRYQEIPRWEKDLFWHIPTDNWQDASPEEADGLPEYMVKESGGKLQINKGTIYRLPKPQELGILFGSMPERTLEAFFNENPGAYKDFGDTVGGLITPSFVPDAVAPVIEQYFNQSFFTGRDIVPHHVKDAIPEYEFDEYTSETAKMLGKMIATVDRSTFDKRLGIASPMVIDNYIQSWGGALGKYVVQTADQALIKLGAAEDNKPAPTLADIPFVKAFVTRYPMAGSKSIQDFYSKSERAREMVATVDMLNETGRYDEANKVMQENEAEFMIGKMSAGMAKGLSAQSQMIQKIMQMPDMSKDEKRQQIDGIYLQMTETAREMNKLIKETEKDMKAGE